MTKDHPFDVFKSPSPSYKYKIGLRGSRTLSVPGSTERSLMNFQPTAKKVQLRFIYLRTRCSWKTPNAIPATPVTSG
jgi:hypothetical protein